MDINRHTVLMLIRYPEEIRFIWIKEKEEKEFSFNSFHIFFSLQIIILLNFK